MFGLLFGYGVARIAARQEARGPCGVRHLLWRRSAVLIGVGFLHALLLYAGDILTAYGVLLLVGAWTVRWKDRWLLVLAVVVLLVTALPNADSSTLLTDPPDLSMLPPDLGTQLVRRAGASLFVATLGPLGFVCPFLVGVWAGRRQVLEHAQDFRVLLRVVAVVGIAAAVAGAQPVALVLSGVDDRPGTSTLELIGPLHDATGVLGGFGYAALIALVAVRIGDRQGRVVTAIAAAGQRSMSCYLMQSVVWAVAFTPYLLDLSDALSVAGTALLAASTWLVTVLVADRMRAAGQRGPFEALVRRVTYAGAR